MSRANVNDRKTVEAVYPREAFEEDAGRNSRDKGEIVFGVRIDSGPDAQGGFSLARAGRHVGELKGSPEAVFIPANQPHLSASSESRLEPGAPDGPVDAQTVRQQEYDAFVERILDAARTANIPEPMGYEDARLKGFRGG